MRVCAADARVRVTEVEPHRPIIPQHAPHLAEHLDESLDERLGGVLQSDLPLGSVVPQPEVGRGRDAAVHAGVFNLAHPFDAVRKAEV